MTYYYAADEPSVQFNFEGRCGIPHDAVLLVQAHGWIAVVPDKWFGKIGKILHIKRALEYFCLPSPISFLRMIKSLVNSHIKLPGMFLAHCACYGVKSLNNVTCVLIMFTLLVCVLYSTMSVEYSPLKCGRILQL